MPSLCDLLTIRSTGLCVAKVVKTFGCVARTPETLDEFRYEIDRSVVLNWPESLPPSTLPPSWSSIQSKCNDEVISAMLVTILLRR